MNEIDWSLWWGEKHVLSIGTHFSVGVAIFLSPTLKVYILTSTEIVKGRVLMVKVKIDGFIFMFRKGFLKN